MTPLPQPPEEPDLGELAVKAIADFLNTIIKAFLFGVLFSYGVRVSGGF